MPNVTRLLIVLCFISSLLGRCHVCEAEELFERHIRPLLAEHCVKCHGAEQQEAGIRLDSRTQVLEGTDEMDPLVVPGKPGQSRLLQVMLYSEDDTQMPPGARLDEPRIAAVHQWIASGAKWPEQGDFGNAAAFDPDAWKQHWAFQPFSDPKRPEIGESDWHPIDSFVRDRLREKGISPSKLADGRTLVRRIAYAVTGLPPSQTDLDRGEKLTGVELQEFLNSYADQQLATSQFGERWARYWLDIARYADTKGYVFREDREYKDAWMFRDWVVNSLNADMPYDEFLKRQIAGDQMAGSDDPTQLAAMGFFTLGRRFLNNKHDIIDDRIDVLMRGTMGLTVACARCHDHKFDPIPTADYYSLYGVFDSSEEPGNEPSTLRLVDRKKPRESFIFVRGGAGNRGERVTRHFLTALSGETPPAPFQHGSGRLELAEKIASVQNPLTARVAVNRIWIRLFGRGLVDSPSDFGVRTPEPSHPELLDHLASYLVANNWSRKALIRYVLRSHTWRQSSNERQDLKEIDPENRLLAGMPRRRLDFEAFRDSMLSVSGRLDPGTGGESVDISKPPYGNRRTLYARIDRQNLPNLFRTFDFASPDNHSAQRFETTVPQQALFQFNNDFVMMTANAIAVDGISTEASNVGITKKLFQRILQRDPSDVELNWANSFLSEIESKRSAMSEPAGWFYGWGELSEDASSVTNFRLLPHFVEGRWSGGSKLPDEKLGWCMLNRDGGHTGHGLKHCPIRRWVSDRNGQVRVASVLQHNNALGDGVRCHVIAGGKSFGSRTVHNGRQTLNSDVIDVVAGQPIDFVTDCRANESHDSFQWRLTVQWLSEGRVERSLKSNEEFSGVQAGASPGAVQQLAHALLLTNEFLFVD